MRWAFCWCFEDVRRRSQGKNRVKPEGYPGAAKLRPLPAQVMEPADADPNVGWGGGGERLQRAW